MKRTILILSALLGGFATCLSAQTPTPAQEKKLSYSVTMDFPYAGKYVFRGRESAKESIQPSIEIASGNFYAGLWMNQPITNNTDNEIDFYAGYFVPLNEFWKVDVGGTFYYYPEADTSAAIEHTFEGYVGITGTVSGFTPGLYSYYDFDLKQFVIQGSVGYSVPLKEVGTSLDFTFTLGNVSPDEGEDYRYWGVGLNLPYKLTDKATVAVGAQYVSNDIDGADDDFLWFTAGLTVGF